MSFFEELKRRNVVRVGVAYAVAAWIILQATDVIGEILDLPDWGGKLILIMLLVGFFLAMFFAWAFELTPDGVKREKDVDRSQSMTRQTGRKLDFVIIALLAMGMAYFIYESRFMDREPESATPVAEVPAATAPPGAAPSEVTDVTEEPAAEPIDPRSIAVLPFANRSLAEEDTFFTDGIHDDLLTQLAKISELKVISRTSVMQYKDTDKPIPEIAKELGVATILEGGVQRAGQRIRINAQLIEVREDQHLWAETFDREMTVENIFDIQSEITRHIVEAVRGELSEEERANLARVPTNNLEAYEAYLQALALINRTDYQADNFTQAEFWADRAVTLDPEFAQAWAMLVEIHGQALWLGYDNNEARREAAKNALEKARRFGPGQPETLAAEAEFAYRIEEDFVKAAERFAAAHEALPSDVDILYRLGVAQRRTPDVEGAIRSFQRAMELDPRHARSPTVLAEMLVAMDELERAEQLISRSILDFPESGDLRVARIDLHRRRGELDMATALFENLAPWTGAAYINLAIEFPFQQRDLQTAIDVWDSPAVAPSIDNRAFIGWREGSRALAYRLMGKEETARSEARTCIAEATNAPPLDSYVYAFELVNLGICYAIAGEPGLAIEAANRAQTLAPEARYQMFGSLISMLRAQVLGMAGQRDEALAEVERLLETPYRFSRWQLYQDARWDFFRDDERFNELIRPEGAGP